MDNLPTTLIPTFAELCAQSSRGIRKIALGVDVREGEYLAHLMDALEEQEDTQHVYANFDIPDEILAEHIA